MAPANPHPTLDLPGVGNTPEVDRSSLIPCSGGAAPRSLDRYLDCGCPTTGGCTGGF